jgi:hypothetical protein
MGKITGLIGLAGVGKTYEANRRVNEDPRNTLRVSFADCLRDIVFDIFGKPENYDNFKIHLITWKFNGRQILENVGSAIRKRDPDFFVKALRNKVKPLLDSCKNVVVDDVRYGNEMSLIIQLIQEHGGELIYIQSVAPSIDTLNNKHESNLLALSYYHNHTPDGEVLYAIS